MLKMWINIFVKNIFSKERGLECGKQEKEMESHIRVRQYIYPLTSYPGKIVQYPLTPFPGKIVQYPLTSYTGKKVQFTFTSYPGKKVQFTLT